MDSGQEQDGGRGKVGVGGYEGRKVTWDSGLGGGMDGGEVGEGEQNEGGVEMDGLRGLYHGLGMQIAKGFLIQGVTF